MENQGVIEKVSRWVNLNELIFDAVLTIIGLVVYRLIVPASGFLTSGIGFWPLFIIVLGVQFIVIVFFGSLFRQFEELTGKLTFLRVLIRIILFLAITGLYVLMPLELYRIFSQTEEIQNDFALAVFGLMGYIMILGAITGFRLDQLKVIKFILYVPGLMTIGTLPITVIYFFTYHGILAGILSIVILAGVMFGVIVLKQHFENKKPTEKPALIRMKSVLLIAGIPILTVAALTVWQEMTLISTARAMANNNMAISPENILPVLLWSGFIPIRILAALAPPYKPVNTVITLGAFYFYYTSLVSIIDKLSGVITK
jgi:hypothetical protein